MFQTSSAGCAGALVKHSIDHGATDARSTRLCRSAAVTTVVDKAVVTNVSIWQWIKFLFGKIHHYVTVLNWRSYSVFTSRDRPSLVSSAISGHLRHLDCLHCKGAPYHLDFSTLFVKIEFLIVLNPDTIVNKRKTCLSLSTYAQCLECD